MNTININIKTGCDIPMPSESIKLGQFIRWGKNKRYYAIGFENGTLFGDWVTNTKVFKAKDGKTHLSKKVIANIRNQNEKRIEEMYAEKALEVQALLNGLTERPIDHPYLVRKGITGKLPDDSKLQAPNMIVIPFYDSQHKISTCQFINEQGHKMFYKGAKKQGSSYSFESKTNNPEIVGLCEGFATGYSLKACLGDEAFIAVAGDAGNLPVVAESVKKRFPDKTLVTFADNDAGKRINGKPYNAGLEAAHAVNPLIYPYKILFPSWTPEIHQSVDWNDIFCNVDIEVMRSKIKKALEENSKEVEVVFKKGETYE